MSEHRRLQVAKRVHVICAQITSPRRALADLIRRVRGWGAPGLGFRQITGDRPLRSPKSGEDPGSPAAAGPINLHRRAPHRENGAQVDVSAWEPNIPFIFRQPTNGIIFPPVNSRQPPKPTRGWFGCVTRSSRTPMSLMEGLSTIMPIITLQRSHLEYKCASATARHQRCLR